MRGRSTVNSLWPNFEDQQTEKAIVGSACNPKIGSIEITLWVLLAGITMSLSGCGSDPLRAYYYQDDQQYRYYEMKSGEVLLVSPNGQVGNATSIVRGGGYPSLNERGGLVWHKGREPEPLAQEISNVSKPQWFPWGNWPLSAPDSIPAAQIPRPNNGPPITLSMVGATTWNPDTADWNMEGNEIAPETGLCRVNALMWAPWFKESYADKPHDPFFKRRSCWHLVWAIPTWTVVDAFYLVDVFFLFGVSTGVMSGGG
jgi:hypothetical protein